MKKLLSLLLALAVAFAIPAGPGLYVADAATSGTAISTADDLKKMENNPSGSYYLKNDIEVTGNIQLFKDRKNPFKGTLDGNSHKITYKYTAARYVADVALFGNTEGATFKNLSISVDINMTGGGNAAGLVENSKNGKFENIKTSGSIKIKNRGTEDDDCCNAVGIVAYESASGTIKNCANSIDIELTHKGQSAPTASGIAGIVGKGSVTKCTNKGKIALTHTPDKDWGSSECEAAGIVGAYYGTKAISGCKNSGKISITGTKATEAYGFAPKAAGIAVISDANIVSCSNTATISINNNASGNRGAEAAGIACEADHIGTKVSKCSNSGAISYTGKPAGGIDIVTVAGVVCSAAKDEQTYNKGKVSVNSKIKADAGGIAGFCADMRNCYNTGAVTHKGTGNAGGLAATATVIGGYVKGNYSTGKVGGNSSSKLFKGQLIGFYSGGFDVMKRNIYNNYYKTSGKAYGAADFTWKPWLAKATKVSSITAKNCPALSSKHWTYSSKYKRMILKNNKEK